MSTANEITRLGNAKAAIASAITEKGVTVPSGTKLDGMAALIGQIETGGGEVQLETWHGRIDAKNYPEVYYTDASGQGVKAEGWNAPSAELAIDVAANTYVIVVGFASSYALAFGCELIGTYDYSAIGAYVHLIKPTGNDFRLVEG